MLTLKIAHLRSKKQQFKGTDEEISDNFMTLFEHKHIHSIIKTIFFLRQLAGN